MSARERWFKVFVVLDVILTLHYLVPASPGCINTERLSRVATALYALEPNILHTANGSITTMPVSRRDSKETIKKQAGAHSFQPSSFYKILALLPFCVRTY